MTTEKLEDHTLEDATESVARDAADGVASPGNPEYRESVAAVAMGGLTNEELVELYHTMGTLVELHKNHRGMAKLEIANRMITNGMTRLWGKGPSHVDKAELLEGHLLTTTEGAKARIRINRSQGMTGKQGFDATVEIDGPLNMDDIGIDLENLRKLALEESDSLVADLESRVNGNEP